MNEESCPVCFEKEQLQTLSTCNHVICLKCKTKIQVINSLCPICRTPFDQVPLQIQSHNSLMFSYTAFLHSYLNSLLKPFLISHLIRTIWVIMTLVITYDIHKKCDVTVLSLSLFTMLNILSVYFLCISLIQILLWMVKHLYGLLFFLCFDIIMLTLLLIWSVSILVYNWKCLNNGNIDALIVLINCAILVRFLFIDKNLLKIIYTNS